MTIAILPMLIEALPFVVTGGVAMVAGMAVWYLFKDEKSTIGSADQKSDQVQTDMITIITPQQQDSPSSDAETDEEIKNESLAIDEPMLKRHHLHNIRLMLEATTFPRPTDSVLSRHYDEMIEAKAEDCLESEIKLARLIADYEAYQAMHDKAEPTEISTEDFDTEPMLRRHHLHNIRMMVMATTFQRPTDSMLSRHYDEMIEAKAEDCLEDEIKMARLLTDYEACKTTDDVEEVFDEQPMLKRHHLHKIRLMLEATTFPRPTDSALSRHYEEMIDAKAADCLVCEAKMNQLFADYEEYEKVQLANKSVSGKAIVSQFTPCVPEDSMLRRHFLTNLRANIEKNKAPRPTDSALRRHYEAMINAEMENYLAYH